MATIIKLTKQQGKTFILLKHGLLGEHEFIGKNGIQSFIEQAGCIQYDPIDVCGKNAELVLQSRVKIFNKPMLYELLYKDRKLVDYPDKNLSILPIKDWPYFERYRKISKENEIKFPRIRQLIDEVRSYIEKMAHPVQKTLNWMDNYIGIQLYIGVLEITSPVPYWNKCILMEN